MVDYLDAAREARTRVYSLERDGELHQLARETPLDRAPLLSNQLKNNVWLKREDLQSVFSFKIRGAANKLLLLNDEERAAGVVAASAGNHAQGVAMSATALGVKATIVMPLTTPSIKVDAVKARGGNVVLHGDNYDAAYEHAREIEAETGATFVHPYDDHDVIAGQGTVGLELAEQLPSPDVVFVPVGGGGLVAGVASVLRTLDPKTLVIGVEPMDAACLHAALEADERVVLDSVGTFSDGVAVRQIGENTFEAAKRWVHEVICVSTREISAAIRDIFQDTRSIAEPAGALAVAGAKRWAVSTGRTNANLVAIVSGANMNFDVLRAVAEDALIGVGQEMLVGVEIPEVPGEFLRFCKTIGDRGITEFNYRYAGPGAAKVFVGVKIANDLERPDVTEALSEAGYRHVDLSWEAAAGYHVRHLVGGPADVPDEEVFRVLFPERPGALRHFLEQMDGRWNVSLFHYRSHGAPWGRVFIGVQPHTEDLQAFRGFLGASGYEWAEETPHSQAYRMFLRPDLDVAYDEDE